MVSVFDSGRRGRLCVDREACRQRPLCDMQKHDTKITHTRNMIERRMVRKRTGRMIIPWLYSLAALYLLAAHSDSCCHLWASSFVVETGVARRAISTNRVPRRSSSLVGPLLESSTKTSTDAPLWDEEKVRKYALDEQGVELSLSTLGPGFRCVARSSTNSSDILGYIEGFIRPSGSILHLDKMQVFAPVVQRLRDDQTNEKFTGGGTPLGIGLLLAYICLLHGLRDGNRCTTAEFLAIHDEDYQHKRLVKLYQLSGFKVVKYVGDDFQDIPDRLIWGGCGTLLREDTRVLLQYWTKLLNKSLARKIADKEDNAG